MAQYIYGKNAILTRLEKGEDLEAIFVTPSFKDPRILNRVPADLVEVVEEAVLARMVQGGVHQGIVARIKTYQYTELDALIKYAEHSKYPLLVMLDGIEDPHNLGAILRSCEAVGVDGVIIPKHESVSLNATVARVSTGAIEYVKVAQVTNLTNTLQLLKSKGYWVVGAEADNATDYRTLDYQMPVVVVIGSESKGITRLVLKHCDFKVKLPMCGKINSLNASVATAVLIYQIYNQRNPIK